MRTDHKDVVIILLAVIMFISILAYFVISCGQPNQRYEEREKKEQVEYERYARAICIKKGGVRFASEDMQEIVCKNGYRENGTFR